jgi:competence protein ComEC
MEGFNSNVLVNINSLDKKFKDIRIGDTITMTGDLRAPSKATNPSQFDYAGYLKNLNVFSVFYVNNNDYNVVYSPQFKWGAGFKNNWYAILRNLDVKREKIIAQHAKYIKSPQLEVLGGVVFGDDAVNPSDDIKQTFLNSGLLHILAASGLNVGIIFFMWYWLLTRFGVGFRPTIVSSIFLITLYTFMTGFPPSILRASIMLLFVLVGKLFNREANPLPLVFFVGFLMLLYDPKMLNSVSFQLSFIVTIALIICVEPVIKLFKEKEEAFKNKHKKAHPYLKQILHFISPEYLAGIVAVPLVAQIAVIPLQAYYFNTFVPYSLFANILAVPFVAVISFLGFLGSIFSLIPFVSGFVLKITDTILSPFIGGLLNVSSYFAHLKGAILNVSSPSVLQIFLYYFIVLIFVKNINLRFKKKPWWIALLVMGIIFAATFIKIPNKNFEIISFDVGNADSFLIKTPNMRYIMIDTGRLPYRGASSAEYIMLRYFKNKNIKKLEYLILTHFDNDHIGGALDILKNIKVKNVVIQNEVCDTKNSCEILKYLKNNKINYRIAKNNDTIFSQDDVEIKTFSANLDENSIEKRKLENENSIIALVSYKHKNSLFMGDAGIAAYRKIDAYLPRNIEILKVGHHGAKNTVDDTMLKELNPKYVIVSVGENIYRHPNDETIDLIKKSQTYLFTTKENGALKFVYSTGENAFVPYVFEDGDFKKALGEVVFKKPTYLKTLFIGE